MSSSPITTAPIDHTLDAVVDAIKDVHDEASLWHLSDELVKVAPSGVRDVERVVAQAAARGIPSKSVNTLRLYRDVAIRFPASERVTGVSFSAHREALSGSNNDPALAKQVLIDLSAKHGPAGVTVTTVKAAMGAATGKVVASKSSVRPTPYAEIAVDLSTANGKAFIAALDAMLNVNKVTLDGLHAGLTSVLSAVEVKRAKAARKAAQAAKSSKAAPAPARPARPKAAPSGKAPVKAGASKAGDLRDL